MNKKGSSIYDAIAWISNVKGLQKEGKGLQK